MAIKRPKPEEIAVKLQKIEMLMGQGTRRIDAIRQISVTHLHPRCSDVKQGEKFQ